MSRKPDGQGATNRPEVGCRESGGRTNVAGLSTLTAAVRRVAALALLAGVMSVMPAAQGVPTCPALDPALATDVILWNSGLKEVSGIQSSLDHPGVLWVVEDSGNGPYLYAVNRDGALLATYTVQGGARNVDWEAIGMHHRDGVDLLYIADIGDNPENRNGTARPTPALYRFAEPEIGASQSPPVAVTLREVETFRFRYFGRSGQMLRPRDAESMFVDPRTGNIFIFLKGVRTVDGVEKVSRVFEIKDQDLVPVDLNQAVHVANVVGAGDGVGTGPVAADISADGEWILVKNYSEGFLWRRPRQQNVIQTLREAPSAPCDVPVDAAESVAFGYSPSGVWLDVLSLRESKDGNPPLHVLERAWV